MGGGSRFGRPFQQFDHDRSYRQNYSITGKSYFSDLNISYSFSFRQPLPLFFFEGYAYPILLVSRPPGDCNDTVPCGFQPVLEIRDIATNRNAGNLGWRGREWRLDARTLQGPEQELVGKRIRLEIPPSGRVQFRNISFYDVATDLQMQFNVTVLPTSASYSIMAVSSQKFDVNSRTFYLAVAVQPADANQTVVFGTQPVIEVRDVGTRRRASPLKQAWWVAVDLGANPKPGVALLSGTRNVSVVDERAPFTDLLITRYGTGFVLRFQSTDGHIVETASFEVNALSSCELGFLFRSAYLQGKHTFCNS